MRQPAERAAGRSTITTTGDRVPVSPMLAGFALLALLVFPFLSMVSALASAEHAALLSRDTLDAMWTTIVAAGVAILADAALGIPLAYWMARSSSRLRHLAVVAVLLPLAVPPVVGGLELVLWLGPYGWLGKLHDHVGLNPLDTIRGTILAQMFIAAPFVIVSARAAFSAVEPAVTDAARSLGCGPWRTLVRVTLPAARRGIAAGLVLGWLRAIGEFGASIIVAYHPFTLSNLPAGGYGRPCRRGPCWLRSASSPPWPSWRSMSRGAGDLRRPPRSPRSRRARSRIRWRPPLRPAPRASLPPRRSTCA